MILGVAAVVGISIVEFRHRAAFGHFVPLTLHADYTVAKGDIGIPGVTKLYDAHLRNFGIIPRLIERCEFLTDAFERGVSVGYRIQQRDKSSGQWHTVLDGASGYCRPYPLSMAQTTLTSKLLWPGQTLSTGEEATSARGNLKGETLRFAVVANGREFPTGGFTIDEQVEQPDLPFRVRH
jgi:hypothetical protein